jgi:Suppressor of fused protein (SUFU)
MMRTMSGEDDAGAQLVAGPPPGWREALDRHCERFLGPCPAVLHELVSDVVHLDLYPHEPAPDRPWTTLRTGGVSDLATGPPAEMASFQHVELLTYLPPTWDLSRRDSWWPGRMLKEIGRYVHQERTWLGPGHTLSLEGGDERDVAGSRFAGAMLLPPDCEPEAFDRLEIAGVPVRFLWMVPLTAAEIDFKLSHGSEDLLDLMRQRRLPQVLNPARACLVTGHAGRAGQG